MIENDPYSENIESIVQVREVFKGNPADRFTIMSFAGGLQAGVSVGYNAIYF